MELQSLRKTYEAESSDPIVKGFVFHIVLEVTSLSYYDTLTWETLNCNFDFAQQCMIAQ